jgi:1-acyl-sn-glycerol-3-phosphate acyltransferase
MSPRLRGLAVATYAGLSMVALFLVQLPVMAVTGSGDFSIWLARAVWAPTALRLGGVKLKVHAPSSLPDGPAIYVSNHESALDVWALFRAIPRNLRFLAKRELFQIPIFGWYLRMARFVEVDRRDRARAIQALRKAGEIVRGGIPLVVFPEGTRSPDGRVQPFKKGPFVVAMEARVPVVPVAISGASDLNPKGRLEVRSGTIQVALGEPVHPDGFADKNELLREVRRRIIGLHRSLGGQGGDLDAAVAMPGVEGRAVAGK